MQIIKLPKEFFQLSTKMEQEKYLVDYLIKYQNVTDEIKKLLAKIRGDHRKLTEEDVIV